LREPDLLLVRFGELALKGGNRSSYEKALRRNLRRALKPLGEVEVRSTHARVLIYPKRRASAMARRAAEIFGVKSVSPAYTVKAEPQAIAELAKELFDDALARNRSPRPIPFRVRSKRADKRFPMQSNELERMVADYIDPSESDVRVDLKNPELVVGIEIRGDENYVFVERIKGPGGLPVGT